MSNSEGIADVIAEREFEFVIGGDTRTITVRIGRPKRGDVDWACPSQILGIGDEEARWTPQVDSLGAMLTTLTRLRTELDVLKETSGGELSWLSEKEDLLFATTDMLHRYLGDAVNFHHCLKSVREWLGACDVPGAEKHREEIDATIAASQWGRSRGTPPAS